MINKERIIELLSKREELHPNDPQIEEIWIELVEAFGNDEKEIISFINELTDDKISTVAEIFEDIAQVINKKSFVDKLGELIKERGLTQIYYQVEYAYKVLEI